MTDKTVAIVGREITAEEPGGFVLCEQRRRHRTTPPVIPGAGVTMPTGAPRAHCWDCGRIPSPTDFGSPEAQR